MMAPLHCPAHDNLAGFQCERRTIIAGHQDVMMMNPDLTQWVVIGSLTTVINAIEDVRENFGGFGPASFSLKTANLWQMRSKMRQFTTRLLDPAAVMVKHNPILNDMAEHECAQRPVAGGYGIFPAGSRLIQGIGHIQLLTFCRSLKERVLERMGDHPFDFHHTNRIGNTVEFDCTWVTTGIEGF